MNFVRFSYNLLYIYNFLVLHSDEETDLHKTVIFLSVTLALHHDSRSRM